MTGNQLKDLIRKLGITQEEAAKTMGVTRRTLQNWFTLGVLDANTSQNVQRKLLQTGDGNMLLSDETNITGVAPVTPVHEEMIAMQRETIAAHKETISVLISTARTHEETIAMQRDMIASLSNKDGTRMHEEIITSQQRIIENLSKKIAEGANSAALREAHG